MERCCKTLRFVYRKEMLMPSEDLSALDETSYTCEMNQGR